jgi:hypothetical protein
MVCQGLLAKNDKKQSNEHAVVVGSLIQADCEERLDLKDAVA